MKRFLLLLLLTPAAHAATYSIALPGGSSFLLNGVLYANPDFTNSATVTWSVDGFGRILATSVGGSANVYTSSNNIFTGTNTFSADTIFLGPASFDTLYVGTLTVTNAFPSSGVTNATASRFAVWGADYKLTNDVAETGTGAPVRADSPVFTGAPEVPTAAAGTSNTVAASTKYVDDAVASIPSSDGYPVRTRFTPIVWDCVLGNGITTLNAGYPSLGGIATSSGTSTYLSGIANHPGMFRLSSAAGANSGYGYGTDITTFRIQGGERFSWVSRPHGTNAGNIVRYGFHDRFESGNIVDGVLALRSNNIVQGVVVSNSVFAYTGTSYSIETNTFYSGTVAVNSDATVATFTLLSEAGATLWTDSITNGLPVSDSRLCGAGVYVINTVGTAYPVEDLDMLAIWNVRTLTR